MGLYDVASIADDVLLEYADKLAKEGIIACVEMRVAGRGEEALNDTLAKTDELSLRYSHIVTTFGIVANEVIKRGL